MSDIMVPGIYSALLWWLTTGIILYLDRLDPSTFPRSMACGAAVSLLAAVGLRTSAPDTTVAGAYVAFTCTVLVWGCLEMSFLFGFITGPRRHACAHPCGGWRHFMHATAAILYNEIATVAGAALVVALTWNATNQLSRWTYAVLWAMRLSAKLNLFLGVPNVGAQFLPPHLTYLGRYFRRRAMNWLFPVSVVSAAYVMGHLVRLCTAAREPRFVTGYALVASLLALAILEHLFMVLPLPTERLWRWALRTTKRV